MRTIVPIMAMLAIAVAGGMLGTSGFAGAWGADPPQTDVAQERLDDSSEDVQPSNSPAEGPVSSADDSIIGLIGSALGSITDIAGVVARLDATLINIGFPAWFAGPIGALASLLVGVGIIQFGVNRRWR